ncbi:MAG TPA: 2-phospho-L-lactate guanylyltransferase [Thermoleophilaceae bacterium]|nr:2-phospho-L-lactate guanylyltransferase [Thermoleophilaceae bacterium]
MSALAGSMKTIAILPVKAFGAAKQRLAPSVVGRERRALAEAMLADVLAALSRVPDLADVAVVTADARAREAALAVGARVVPDAEQAGQSPAAVAGIGHALASGAARVLLVPGDTPLLDAVELSELLARAARRAPSVTIVPDRHGTGTNALVLDPPDAIAPSFGPGSFERHRAAAEAAGLPVLVERTPTLMLDVDTGDDLGELVAQLAARAGAAPATRATLAPSRVTA